MHVTLSDDLETAALQTGDFVHGAVRKRYWTAQKLREKYLLRTTEEILEDGETNAVGPCPERTLIATKILLANGYSPSIIFHEWQAPGFDAPVMHLIIEIPSKTVSNRIVTLEFSTANTLCQPGTYAWDDVLETTRTKRSIPSSTFKDQIDTIRPAELLTNLADDKKAMTLLTLAYAARGRGKYGEYVEDVYLFDRNMARTSGLSAEEERADR